MFIDSSVSFQTILISIGGLITGYAALLILMFLLPRRLRAENLEQRHAVIYKASKRRDLILKEARLRDEESLSLSKEEWEANLADTLQDLQVAEVELDAQESYAAQTESRIARHEKELSNHQIKVETLRGQVQAMSDQLEVTRSTLQKSLEDIAGAGKEDLKSHLRDNLIRDRQLESQKRIKDVSEELNTNSKKLADRMLSRALSRYAPEFVWPKAVNHIDLLDPKLVDVIGSDGCRLLPDLRELTQGVEISAPSEIENGISTIRLGGGYGIYKEAARLTLEELLNKSPENWDRVASVYERHKGVLEKTAIKLGRQAIKELKIESMHDEILKMIGALNWRTSYRQNQYFHSVEVARLAGILAYEVKVDPNLAKRCGLLHDIGKGIDYRIEGSHAVISGDYADRFGEHRVICDTVMSHHNDLVLETPLSYVLKTADTLSGARPGARINLEEGYQDRLSAIDQVVRSFPGIVKIGIMNGGREVHIEVNHKKIREHEIEDLTRAIARKIEEDVAFPGQIKVLVTRRFEAVAVA